MGRGRSRCSDPAPNLFRFEADYGQGVAGLATYAYRRARVAAGGDRGLRNWPSGWLERDAFAAEFCALGGSVTDQIGIRSIRAVGTRSVPRDVDGVAVFTGQFYDPARS